VRLRPEHADHVWAWDFIFDRTARGQSLKWLSVVDEYTRECLALVAARSITAEDVLDLLAELFVVRGVPRHVRSDNGPEFIAQAVRTWLERTGANTLYIAPGGAEAPGCCGLRPDPGGTRARRGSRRPASPG
jgi:transposase InsO family protein